MISSAVRRRLWQRTPVYAKRVLAPVLAAVPTAAWLGHRFRAQLRFLREADRWSAAQAREFQLAQLRRLCRIAAGRSAWYRARFGEIGFEPWDLRSLDDFACLPLLESDTVRAQADLLATAPAGLGGGEWVSTGGTGGRPLRFRINANRSPFEYAHLVASWERAGYRLGLAQAVFRGEVVPPERCGLRHLYDPILRRHVYSNFHMGDDEIRRYAAHLETIGPFFLLVYPSSASALAQAVARLGLAVPAGLRGVLAGSENVYPEDRERVEGILGVRYFSWYGQSEKVAFAAECEQATDYHCYPTYGYTELIDAQGRPVTTPGQTGEIVATGFTNTVTPFIRYRTGDLAVYAGQRCAACGREQLVLRDIRGHRTHEMLIAADGGAISWTALNMHDDTFGQVRQFQFRQELPGRAVLRVVPANGFGPEVAARILDRLRRKLAGRVDVTLEVAEEIALTPRGKVTYVDQRVPAGRGASIPLESA